MQSLNSQLTLNIWDYYDQINIMILSTVFLKCECFHNSIRNKIENNNEPKFVLRSIK